MGTVNSMDLPAECAYFRCHSLRPIIGQPPRRQAGTRAKMTAVHRLMLITWQYEVLGGSANSVRSEWLK
jgi:hypothetical protein